MGLIAPVEYLKKVDNLAYPHKGKVVKTDKDEDKKLGRIKCKVKGIFEDTAEDKKRLPWIYPMNPYGLGGSPTTSGFSVPEEDSEVTVIFPFGDVYHPYYTGYWQSELTHQEELFDEDYPHLYGFIDSVIHWIRINKRVGDSDEKSWIELFRNYLGDLIRIDEEGNFWINIPKSIYIKIGEDRFVEIGKNDTRKVVENSTESVGKNHEIHVGDNHGLLVTNELTHQARRIDHNSGIIINEVPPREEDLEAKIEELDAKVEELKAMATRIKAKAEQNKTKIADPDNIE